MLITVLFVREKSIHDRLDSFFKRGKLLDKHLDDTVFKMMPQ